MPGRLEDAAVFLGKPIGEPETETSRNGKAETTTYRFENGWVIVAARLGSAPKEKFRAVIRRCEIDLFGECSKPRHAGKHGCLGHPESIVKLAHKIRSLYR